MTRGRDEQGTKWPGTKWKGTNRRVTVKKPKKTAKVRILFRRVSSFDDHARQHVDVGKHWCLTLSLFYYTANSRTWCKVTENNGFQWYRHLNQRAVHLFGTSMKHVWEAKRKGVVGRRDIQISINMVIGSFFSELEDKEQFSTKISSNRATWPRVPGNSVVARKKKVVKIGIFCMHALLHVRELLHAGSRRDYRILFARQPTVSVGLTDNTLLWAKLAFASFESRKGSASVTHACPNVNIWQPCERDRSLSGESPARPITGRDKKVRDEILDGSGSDNELAPQFFTHSQWKRFKLGANNAKIVTWNPLSSSGDTPDLADLLLVDRVAISLVRFVIIIKCLVSTFRCKDPEAQSMIHVVWFFPSSNWLPWPGRHWHSKKEKLLLHKRTWK
jgi:hypothetical protein